MNGVCVFKIRLVGTPLMKLTNYLTIKDDKWKIESKDMRVTNDFQLHNNYSLTI